MDNKKCPVCGGLKYEVLEEYISPPAELRRCQCGHAYQGPKEGKK